MKFTLKNLPGTGLQTGIPRLLPAVLFFLALLLQVYFSRASNEPKRALLPEAEHTGCFVVNADLLNLREGPGKEFAILQQFVRDETVEGHGVYGEWIEVADSLGVMGYVQKEYLLPCNRIPDPGLPEGVQIPTQNAQNAYTLSETQNASSDSEPAGEVLICESATSYAYHRHVCSGLKRCTHKISQVTLQKAQSMGRKACNYCW